MIAECSCGFSGGECGCVILTPSTRLTRKRSTLKRTPLKKVGAGKAKREKRTAAWRRSKEYKALRVAALERAGNRCERVSVLWKLLGDGPSQAIRCPETTRLEMHEIRYTGRLEDVLILCHRHHMELESQLRPWNRNQLGKRTAV